VYVGLIFGFGALVLVGVATYTAYKVEHVNSLARAAEQQAAEADLTQSLRTLVADSRSILREVALWDETRKQLDNPVYYQFWWRNRLMNPARIPHYVQWLEVYTAEGQSLSSVKETPLPETLPADQTYVAWDGYGNSLINFVPILGQIGVLPPIGYLGVRISLPLALPEIYQFRDLQPDTLKIDLPPDRLIEVEDAHMFASYELPATSEILPLINAVNTGTTYLILVNMVLLFVMVWLARVLLVRPLLRLQSFLYALKDRPDTAEAQHFRVRELQSLHSTLCDYHAELRTLHEDLDRKNAELWHIAHIDALTGVRNRRAFEEDWEKIASSEVGVNNTISFVMFDCDQLKSINDTYGHEVGDNVLRRIATLISEALGEGTTLYRLGGDEFATILTGLVAEAAESLANRCLDSVANADYQELGMCEPLCISIGLARGQPMNRDELDDLARQADAAMYRSKRPVGPKLSVHDGR
jgi:diguanylate cyclase (GGDEF)-like protein